MNEKMCNRILLAGLMMAAVSSGVAESNGPKIIKRTDWGGQPSVHPPTPLSEVPAPYVIISHTAWDPCLTQDECSQRVLTAQTMHITSNKWDDIAYNFLVGGDGNIYEGRGWDVEGAHTLQYNKKSIGICFIGTFNTVAPSLHQLKAAQDLLEVGVKTGKLTDNYKLLGHRQFTETQSPGDELYKILKTWSHWSEKP